MLLTCSAFFSKFQYLFKNNFRLIDYNLILTGLTLNRELMNSILFNFLSYYFLFPKIYLLRDSLNGCLEFLINHLILNCMRIIERRNDLKAINCPIHMLICFKLKLLIYLLDRLVSNFFSLKKNKKSIILNHTINV